MITETGRIVAIENDGLWVQTIRQSACAQCSAQKGCGQAVLARMGREPGYIKVGLQDYQASDFQLDEFVQIGIGEDVLVKSTLLIYIIPLLTLMLGIFSGSQIVQAEWAAVLGGVLGLGLGSLIAQVILSRNNGNARLQPILLGAVSRPVVWPQ